MNTPAALDQRIEREAWLEARKHYIGATDCASILGKGFGTALSVYNEKLGLPNVEPDEDQLFRMDVGTALEPLLGEYFTRETKMPLVRVPTMFHPEHSFIGANLDFLSADGRAVVETKTYGIGRHHEFGDEGTDDVPDGYHIQLTIQMGLAILNGYEVQGGFLYACSLGSQARKIWTVPFDQEFFDLLVSRMCDFWNGHVIPQVPPQPVAKDEDRVRLAYPSDDGSFVLSDPEDDDLVEQLLGLSARKKASVEAFDAKKVLLISRIGEHAGMDTAHGRVTFKASASKSVTDWQAVAQGLRPFTDVDVYLDTVNAHTELKAGSRRLLLPKESN